MGTVTEIVAVSAGLFVSPSLTTKLTVRVVATALVVLNVMASSAASHCASVAVLPAE